MFRRLGVTAAAALFSSVVVLAGASVASADSTGTTTSVDRGVATTQRAVALAEGRTSTIDLPEAPTSLSVLDLPVGVELSLRVRAEGRWSAPEHLVAAVGEAPDHESTAASSVGPVWLGRGVDAIALIADADLTVRVHTEREVDVPASAAAETATTTSTTTSTTSTPSDTASDTASTTTTSTTSTTIPDDSPVAAADDESVVSPDGAFIRPRSGWASDEMEWACDDPPRVADPVQALVVHHTAGRNEYLPEDVPAIIRSIWRYHVETRGWCDIAYNAVIDRFGTVWEARQGGIALPIIGGHAYGYNSNSVGIAQLGHFDEAETPPELTEATARLLGWKAGIHQIDPTGVTTLTNRGANSINGVASGEEIEAPTVLGHRDLGETACPGEHTYDTLETLRTDAALGFQIVALQTAFLRATADPGRYAKWLDVATEEDLGAVALGLARSEDYSGLIVDDLYQRVLGRGADDAGMAYWLEQLSAGTRIETVGISFYGSREYVDSFASSADYIRALYDNLLHREPEGDGLEFWVATLDGGFLDPPAVARGFYESLESRRDRVAGLYDDFLGRPPDRSGHEYWAEALLTTDDILLAVHLSLSPEFFERAVA